MGKKIFKNKINNNFSKKINRFEKARRREILKWITGNKIIDMGSIGNGQYKPNLHQFLKKSNKTVVGIDKTKNINVDKVIDLNKKHYQIKSESFDTIIAGEIIEHLNYPMIFLEECKRILKSNGRLIITTPNMTSISYILGIVKNINKKDYHCHAWSMDLFDSLVFRAGFKVIYKKLFNSLATWDYVLDLLTKIFPVFKTEMFYVLEKNSG